MFNTLVKAKAKGLLETGSVRFLLVFTHSLCSRSWENSKNPGETIEGMYVDKQCMKTFRLIHYLRKKRRGWNKRKEGAGSKAPRWLQ